MLTIKNDYITATFKEIGAEMKSLVCGGTEYIWQGDPKFWGSSTPFLFPICGGLRDDEYFLAGEKYSLQKHGFIRFCKFEVEEKSDNSITFIQTANEDTKREFPFDYELRVKYTLEGKKLTVEYIVKNTDNKKMYFSIGAHDGYATPEGIEEYDFILPEAESLYASELVGSLIGENETKITDNTDTLALKYDYFSVDALVFKSMKARSATLKNRNNGREFKITFDGFDYFLLWTKPDAPYICLEPWCGIHDSVNADKNIETKEGIIALESGETFSAVRTLEIIK